MKIKVFDLGIDGKLQGRRSVTKGFRIQLFKLLRNAKICFKIKLEYCELYLDVTQNKPHASRSVWQGYRETPKERFMYWQHTRISMVLALSS